MTRRSDCVPPAELVAGMENRLLRRRALLGHHAQCPRGILGRSRVK
jgi:hypothetical protein